MGNIEVLTRLSFIIEQLSRAGDYNIANELMLIQLELIEERSKGWNEGFNTGYGLARRKEELTKGIAKL